MNFKTTKLLFGVSMVLGLLFSFACPNIVHASAKTAPITKFESVPSNPKGQNDWYTCATSIELDTNQSDASVKTYFQWNTTSGKWQLFKEPFKAWKGENTLYFYSVNSQGMKEAVQSKTIKVDYTKPVIENLKSISVDGTTNLSWTSQTDVVNYRVYRLAYGRYELLTQTKTNSFVDHDVLVGETYVYAVKAIDQAGLVSKLKTSSVKVSKQVEVATSAKINREIGKGAAITDLKKKPIEQAQKTENAPAVNSEQTKEKPTKRPARNWNHLLVAISILVIASGAAIGGYYAYGWWAGRGEEPVKKEKKSNSRW